MQRIVLVISLEILRIWCLFVKHVVENNKKCRDNGNKKCRKAYENQ